MYDTTKKFTIQLLGSDIEQLYCGLRDLATLQRERNTQEEDYSDTAFAEQNEKMADDIERQFLAQVK